jgi:hypothetical protein
MICFKYIENNQILGDFGYNATHDEEVSFFHSFPPYAAWLIMIRDVERAIKPHSIIHSLYGYRLWVCGCVFYGK